METWLIDEYRRRAHAHPMQRDTSTNSVGSDPQATHLALHAQAPAADGSGVQGQAAPSTRSVVILGARGRLGSALVDAFSREGWKVFAVARGSAPMLEGRAGVHCIAADVQDVETIAKFASGAEVVVHAVNPLYTRWATEVMPSARAAMQLASRLGARFMLPGNVYNFGAEMPAQIVEDAPQHPTTRKGNIRVELEQEIEQRCQQGELRATVLRAGDFFGCGPGSWFDQAIVASLRSGKVVYPSRLDIPHAWAYVPDLAKTFVQLANRDDRRVDAFEQLHFAGHGVDGETFLSAIERVMQREAPKQRVRRGGLPWWIFKIGALFVPMWREILEMSYLWHTPHVLDDAKLRAQIHDVPHTDLDDAVHAALCDLGLLERRALPLS